MTGHSEGSLSPRKATINVVLIALTITVIVATALAAQGKFKEASSVCMGSLAALISVTILSVSIYSIFIKGRAHAFFWGLIVILKLLAVGILIWYVLGRGLAEPISFLGGVTAVMLSLIVQAISLNCTAKRT